jgi:hypothetical protein
MSCEIDGKSSTSNTAYLFQYYNSSIGLQIFIWLPNEYFEYIVDENVYILIVMYVELLKKLAG